MDIEQLKMVIEVLNNLGANAKVGFIVWIIVSFGHVYLFGAVWSLIGFSVLKWGYGLAKTAMLSTKLKESADISYQWSEDELKRACEILKENVHYIHWGTRDKSQ